MNAHRVSKKIAKRGKNAASWLYELKLHLITDQIGEIFLTPGNIYDCVAASELSRDLFGKLFEN